MRVLGQRLALLTLLLLWLAIPSRATVWVLTADLTGSQVAPPVATSAKGQAIMSYDDVSKLFNLAVYEWGISQSDILSAKIHLGAPGVNGPAIYDLGGGASWIGSGVVYARFITGALFPAAYEVDLLAGRTYIIINTPAYPAGEIRGQLIPVPEPVTLVGLSMGLGLLAFRKRRK